MPFLKARLFRLLQAVRLRLTAGLSACARLASEGPGRSGVLWIDYQTGARRKPRPDGRGKTALTLTIVRVRLAICRTLYHAQGRVARPLGEV